jgi:hypothetical protein
MSSSIPSGSVRPAAGTHVATIALHRRWGVRTLAVAAVATACAVPTAGAWAASGHGHPAKPTHRAVVTATSHAAKPGTAKPRYQVMTWPWGQALHGDLTMPSGTGTRAVVLQRGAITAVTDTTITVTSTDSYTTTWTLTSTTKVAGRRLTTPTPTPTSGSATSSSTTSSATTAGLIIGRQVGVWGTGDTSSPTATAVALLSTPRTPAPTSTSAS